MKITLDLRFVTVVLLLVIIAMVALWRPWQTSKAKTITVTGQATVTATPDEFIFNPTYQKKAANVNDAISQVSEIGNSTVTKIKELGVADKDIKTNVTSNPNFEPLTGRPSNDFAAQYSLTITVRTEALAKKVLDYIATTPTVYGVSPQSTFSVEKRKELESQARGKALTDARGKAEQTATGLGVRLGKVESVTDNSGFGGPITLEGRGAASKSMAADQAITPPVLQTGTQDIMFSVSVVYIIH